MVSGGKITPGIVGVGDQLGAIFGVYRYNITLQVLFKPVGIEIACEIVRMAVLHTNRAAVYIIEIQNEMVAPFLRNDQITIQPVDMLDAIDCLTGADALVVVGEGQCITVSFCLRQPTAMLLCSSGGKNRRCYG